MFKRIDSILWNHLVQYLSHLQSESPSASELNALGLYLLVCLSFVICALVEFAIAIVLHRRKESSAVSDAPTLKTPALTNQEDNRWVAKLGTNLFVVPSTNAIDFMAIWIYLAMFFMFNCIYWKTY